MGGGRLGWGGAVKIRGQFCGPHEIIKYIVPKLAKFEVQVTLKEMQEMRRG